MMIGRPLARSGFNYLPEHAGESFALLLLERLAWKQYTVLYGSGSQTF